MEGIIALLIFVFGVLVAVFFMFGLFILAAWILAHTNIFFMFLQEGHGAAIVKGGALVENERGQLTIEGGSVHKFLVSMRGRRVEHDTTTNTWEIKDGDPQHKGLLGFLEKHLGVYFIGIWPFYQLYRYEFRWMEWKPGGKEIEAWPRDEVTNFFYVSTARYAVVLERAETGGKISGKELGGNLQVNVKASLFVQIIRPEVALFRNVDWFIQLQEYVLSAMKDYVGSRNFENLRDETSPEGVSVPQQGNFSEVICKLNTEIKGKEGGVETLLGVKIVNVQMLTVDLVGDSTGKVAEATTAIYVAEQKKQAVITEAQGDAEAIRIRAKADQEAIGMRYSAVEGFPHGPMIRRLEAIEKAGEGGNVVIFEGEADREGGNQTTRLLSAILGAVKQSGGSKRGRYRGHQQPSEGPRNQPGSGERR
jgi:hypothetical protein